MDDRRFDALSRALAVERNRRSALKALLGIGSIATVGAIVLDDVEAARRGEPPAAPTPRPTVPPAPPTSTNAAPAQVPPSATASCPGVLCNGACCNGQCTSTGACCPAGSTVCGPDCCPIGQAECCDNACCYGACYGEELCCPTGRIACNGLCLPSGGCCTDADCPGARCLQNVCVPSTPTEPPPPTATATATPVCQEDTDCGPCTCSNEGRDITCPNCFDGVCVFTPGLCPDGTSCIEGGCHGFTPTRTNTGTATPTATSTESPTPTSTATETPTATMTPTETGTPTETPTATPTATASSTPSATETPSETPTQSATTESTSTQSPTATPSETTTPSATATRTATPVPPSMTSFMLALPDRCYVAVSLSGFPPNDRVNFSMLALQDGLVYKFLDDQYYNDVPIDEHGNLEQFVMGPVWVEPDPRDPFAVISVSPIAYSPAADLYASADFLELPAVCNPD